ncbi:putative aminopeptidase W07G4.4 [Ornithodoros turicata]|uniref:putative aminopeptidase W07G4.4 n=1 Tax=Ornithodoros turicata TaxID=34597 RepID=UPI00313996F7
MLSDAACKGIKRALSAGAKRPLLVLPTGVEKLYPRHDVATLLGALHALYVPLEIREDVPSRLQKVNCLGLINWPGGQQALRYACAIEYGRIICRDIGGSDPERMAAPNVAAYVQQVFKDTPVQVEVISDTKTIEKEYPLLGAVNRAARGIERHRARLVLLTYVPEGPVETTLYLVGKGVTYDTGGADVKAGGVMAGMHRDKCGAAAVAGFFRTLCELRPRGLKVRGAMAMVRNSIGSDCYVSDEIITARSGVRVRVGNTDAEGRMAMVDVLSQFKDEAVNDRDPYLFTVATLTGHVCLAYGEGYAAIMDNGPARNKKMSTRVQEAGAALGDAFEISTIRREDYSFCCGPSEYEDVLQCNNLPSSRTPRGHQLPAGFLIRVSGLDKHGLDSEKPLCYSHVDIAAASGPYPGIPSGSPIPALVEAFVGHA